MSVAVQRRPLYNDARCTTTPVVRVVVVQGPLYDDGRGKRVFVGEETETEREVREGGREGGRRERERVRPQARAAPGPSGPSAATIRSAHPPSRPYYDPWRKQR